MKTSEITLLFLISIMVFFPLTSGLSIQMKQKYEQGETIIAKVIGNVIEPIEKEQIVFQRDGHVEVPFDYDVKRIGEDWYIWAISPLDVNNNYSLILGGITTTQDGINKKINYTQNFSVGGNKTEYSIKPGAIITKGEFEITAILYQDEDKIITLDFPQTREVRLKPGVNVITFPFVNSNGIKTYMVKVGKYSVPVQVTGNGTWINPPSDVTIEPNRISHFFREGEKVPPYQIKITTTSKKDVNNISFRYNSALMDINPEIDKIIAKKDNFFNVTFDLKNERGISETIYIDFNGSSIAIPVEIRFIENRTGLNRSNITNTTNPSWYCFELSGKVCSTSEYCEGDKENALDGECCTGTCLSAKQEEKPKKWVGFFIAGLVILLIGILYFQYKKTKADPNQMEKRIKEAEKSVNLP